MKKSRKLLITGAVVGVTSIAHLIDNFIILWAIQYIIGLSIIGYSFYILKNED
jgi:hypothetical protein